MSDQLPRIVASLKRTLSRIALAGVTLFCISALVFCLIHLIPGDPVDVMLGEGASLADRESLRQQLGLTAPLSVQFVNYYTNLAALDLGVSLQTQQPISELLASRAPYTFALAGVALGFALLLALPFGIWAALRPQRWPDQLSAGFALLGGAFPSFVLGPILIVIFAVQLGWLPIGGADSARSVVLPAATLSLGLAAILSRQLRAALLSVLAEPYLRAAIARGLPFATVVRRHALRNAALPVLTVFGMQLGVLLGGAVITETVFAWPGLGTLTIEAIERRDYPVLQACILFISTTYVVINTLTDLASAWCDPRIDAAR
jgi:peptide/nickel transport system permease protein